jgi:intracellular sulfur oxidation DsrE/DsrF family protein
LTALTISTYGIGQSDIALNQTLLTNYLKVLLKLNKAPDYICFYSDGVKVVCSDSIFIESLKELEAMGSKIILCKTCVDYFNIADQIVIGEIGTMLQIVEAQLSASINLKP